MPVVTRSAARRIDALKDAAPESTTTSQQPPLALEDLGLRENVTTRSDAVLEHRDGHCDYHNVLLELCPESPAYNTSTRRHPGRNEVDHVIECQQNEVMLASAIQNLSLGTRARSHDMEMARHHIYQAVNDVSNLNVTTRAVNMSKQGPIRKALRMFTEHQAPTPVWELATDRTRWLFVDGDNVDADAVFGSGESLWTGIERTVVKAHDALRENLLGGGTRGSTYGARRIVEAWCDATTDFMESYALLST